METTELVVLILILVCLLDDKTSTKEWWANWKAAWKDRAAGKDMRAVREER